MNDRFHLVVGLIFWTEILVFVFFAGACFGK